MSWPLTDKQISGNATVRVINNNGFHSVNFLRSRYKMMFHEVQYQYFLKRLSPRRKVNVLLLTPKQEQHEKREKKLIPSTLVLYSLLRINSISNAHDHYNKEISNAKACKKKLLNDGKYKCKHSCEYAFYYKR